ncbi:MAG TPA: hypothetical protein VET89_09215 [Stellaceae bacterium]|nr:hypothetical protein [Stellaceae bacterium]
MPWPAGIAGSRPAVSIWRRMGKTLRALWAATIALPDRGSAATADDVPREFYRFPMF